MQRIGFSIGRIAGIEIRLEPSLLIIFLLIVGSLAMSLFPAWHPAWDASTSWIVAVAAGVLFVGSVLLHELAHALVALAFGLPVRTITLYLFGGLASIEEEPHRPGAELLIAVVGPLTSIGLGVLFLMLSSLVAGPMDLEGPERFVRGLGPLATLLAWLGPVNLILGVFNLLPGFPLDGGRVLRAGLWKMTGDYVKATRWASNSGRLLGWLLMGCGVAMALGVWVPVLGTGLVNGVWIVMIGWFLSRLAVATYQRTALEAALGHVPVGEVMARHLKSVPPDLTLEAFADGYLTQHDQLSWPVVVDARLVGLVSAEDLLEVPRDAWSRTTLAHVMVTADRVPVTTPDHTATDALRKLTTSDTATVAVEEGGHLLGLVRQLDIVRWLRLHADARPS